MTTLQPTENICSHAFVGTYVPRWWTVVAAQATAAVIYVVAAPIGGIDLSARSGDTTTTVTFSLVMSATLIAGIAALLWMLTLRRLTSHPNRNWTISAAIVLIVSLLGPLGASSLAAGIALAGMHIGFASVLAAGSLPWHRARLG